MMVGYIWRSLHAAKYWRMKYRRPTDKKEDRLAFGVYPAVSLADARTKRDEAKKLLAQGIDPKIEKKGGYLSRQEHIPLNGLPVNGMPVINGGVKTTATGFCAVLSNTFSLILAGLIFPF